MNVDFFAVVKDTFRLPGGLPPDVKVKVQLGNIDAFPIQHGSIARGFPFLRSFFGSYLLFHGVCVDKAHIRRMPCTLGDKAKMVDAAIRRDHRRGFQTSVHRFDEQMRCFSCGACFNHPAGGVSYDDFIDFFPRL